jgi:hypothetical protein
MESPPRPQVTRYASLAASAAFGWPYLIDATGAASERRMVAMLAALLLAGGRCWIAIRAFRAASRKAALGSLRRGGVVLAVTSLWATPFDVPSILSRAGLASLVSVAVLRAVGALVYASLVGAVLWPLVTTASGRRWDATPVAAGVCAALPFACTSLIAWSWIAGTTADPVWRLRVAYSVILPVVIGVAVTLVRGRWR